MTSMDPDPSRTPDLEPGGGGAPGRAPPAKHPTTRGWGPAPPTP
ncbi:DUF6480 family protein, partial [Nocardia cyriacigeorgica]